MSKISFDDGPQLGYVLEGVLRKSEDGWLIETYDGTEERLEDVLDEYKNKEIRLTTVDLKEAEHLQNLLQQGAENVEGKDP